MAESIEQLNTVRTVLVRRNGNPDEFDRVFFEVYLDKDEVMKLARKAIHSAGRKSKGGPISVLITSVRPEQKP